MIDKFLNDPLFTELMWNDFRTSFAERDGKLVPIESPFMTAAAYAQFVESLRERASNGGDDSFDGVLPDGSRFHVTLPPMSPGGPTLTIRKFSAQYLDLDALVLAKALTEKAAVFLKASVRARVNIVISGATGAGKTTLLNAMVSQASESERIITVEDVAEIRLRQANWIRLVATRAKSFEAVRECLVGCLRMRPDRIIVGECRSSETLEMLQIMNTGHPGSMSTLHANSSYDALSRLESLILFHAGAEIPLRALRRQIADAVDLIVHIERAPGGSRRVSEILEVTGTEGDVITKLPLFKLNGEKIASTGQVPTFAPRFAEHGVPLPKNFFATEAFEAPNILKINRVAV